MARAKRWVAIALTLSTLATFSGHVSANEMRVVTFGGASLEGNYYAIARGLCQKINEAGHDDLRCSPESTPGSLYNLFAMQHGELDFALVQSDWQRAATEGSGPFADGGPMAELRSVMALYQEAVTLVTRRDQEIAFLGDLEGHSLDIGHPSTGRRGTTQRLMDAMNWPEGNVELQELSGPAVRDALCVGAVDASILVMGHPNPTVEQALAECDLTLVPVAGPNVDALVESSAEYSRFVIPAGTYPGMDRNIRTFSVAATLVVRADIPDDIVALFVTTLLENWESLSEEIPVLSSKNPLLDHGAGISAPRHPGAVAAFATFGGG